MNDDEWLAWLEDYYLKGKIHKTNTPKTIRFIIEMENLIQAAKDKVKKEAKKG